MTLSSCSYSEVRKSIYRPTQNFALKFNILSVDAGVSGRYNVLGYRIKSHMVDPFRVSAPPIGMKNVFDISNSPI